ncbi:hypothetical protein ACFQY5_33550 [Paeniroseomonas aquatica]|uniref:Uncharacterized protein n=1 Tax=Paeniroseomonas aquatica TaxID=373043 RepID=A0ABT8AFE0_9PROT|nr:hypothetical protein [Paeniroseomonas aquatica]MDN3568491.1 hypothetical protein [Paeniroseomonas aquatica]
MTKTFGFGATLRWLPLCGVALLAMVMPALAQSVDLTLEERTVNINGTDRPAVTVTHQSVT